MVEFDVVRIRALIRSASNVAVEVYHGWRQQGLFEHRVPFYFVAGVYLDGQGMVEYERSVQGDPAEWAVPFDGIASSKYSISSRTGRDTVDVPLEERLVDDTQYWGSVVLEFEGGRIVVAISGLQPWFDEALSGIAARALLGLLKHEELVPRGPEPNRDKPPFLTEEWLTEIKAAAAARTPQ